jgi:hypothetical protein
LERAGAVDADPGTAGGRVYAVAGLDGPTRDRLRTAASAAGCRFLVAEGGDRGFLCGTEASLATLADRTDVPRPLAGTLPGGGTEKR